jgi:hypothetical protein
MNNRNGKYHGDSVESVALKLVTAEGYPMAVGGLCLLGTGERWKKSFLTLASLRLHGENPYTIDYIVAKALHTIADDSLLIAGCSVRVDVDLPWGERTGGVLGYPGDRICSAANTCETLPGGFSMYTTAGGPGLAALADPITTENVATALKTSEHTMSGKMILNYLCAFGIEIFLLVCDGSGPDARACLAAGNRRKSMIIFPK